MKLFVLAFFIMLIAHPIGCADIETQQDLPDDSSDFTRTGNENDNAENTEFPAATWPVKAPAA
ncbi:MAG: hypothetical protein ACYS8W_18255 [Planctomycetota bacterium]